MAPEPQLLQKLTIYLNCVKFEETMLGFVHCGTGRDVLQNAHEFINA
jgi:hypothetical protein